MNLAFAGSGAFGIPALRALAKTDLAPCLVISQPDRPAGRKRQLTAQPLAAEAEALGLPVFKPERIGRRAVREHLESFDLDLMIVVAYGQILGPKTLALPRKGCLNIHGSLLPRHRGASPIQAALAHGDEVSGVTIMQMDLGLDTGPMLLRESTPIVPHETAGELHDRLAEMGGAMIEAAVRGHLDDRLSAEPQAEDAATTCGLIAKADGLIDWSRPARELVWHVQAMTPWPGAATTIDVAGQATRVVIVRAQALAEQGPPGRVLEAGPQRLVIGCGEGSLEALVVQRAGKRALDAPEFLRGTPVATGDMWGGQSS